MYNYAQEDFFILEGLPILYFSPQNAPYRLTN